MSMNIIKSDVIGSFIIGFFFAVFFIVLSYVTISILRPNENPPGYYWYALIILPILSTIGIVVINDLKNRLRGIFVLGYQFYKFVIVGGMNTLLDLSILNGLIIFTGIAAGWEFSAFKGASFAVAVINSYFWNKFWTFRKKQGGGFGEFGQFVAVSLVGLGVNVGAASLLVNFVGPQGGIPPQLWASVGAVAAIVFSTVWNFIGYKLFVFKKT